MKYENKELKLISIFLLQNVQISKCYDTCLSQNAAGRPEEYFLYGCFLEASMIEKKVGDKPVHFEISVGKCRNRFVS